MKAAEFAELLQLSHEDQQKLTNIEITDVTQDTRQLSDGCCFVAIKGLRFNGHEHVQEAVDAGARLIVVDEPVTMTGDVTVITVPDTHKALAQISARFFGDPSAQMTMFGVTGTNGKTTITHLISKILDDHDSKTGIIGTMYNKIGYEKIPTVNTTPDPHTVQKLLREMVDQDVMECAMEVSSIALVEGRAWGIDFDTAVFTNLTEDHLDFHKTVENYFDAKTLLFSQLGNSYHKTGKPKTAVINIDDPYGRRLIDKTAANVLTYGTHGQGLLQANNIRVTSHGTEFDLSIYGHNYPVKLQLMGDFNVYNALAAFGATYEHGLAPEDIIASLESVQGVRGRFQVVPNDQDVTVIVDYAHTPDGLKNVLNTINAFAEKRVYCVVGCGGDRETTKRPIMAEIALNNSTDAIFTADNPRTEDPEAILDEMVAGIPADSYSRNSDRREAIYMALSKAQPGDVVLIAGKGHEDYQIIGTTKHHFDDVEVVNSFFDQQD